MENKKIEIIAPDGFEFDKENSTNNKIVFKKVEEIDFSILNDTDWFYVEYGNDRHIYYFKGYPFDCDNCVDFVCLETDKAIKSTIRKEYVKLLRKCTPEEIETIKSKFPELFEKEYAMSVKDIPNRYWFIDVNGYVKNCVTDTINQVSTPKRAEALLELSQLLELIDAYNKIDECVIDWEDGDQIKYFIEIYKNKLYKNDNYYTKHLFTFGKESTRDLFFDRFQDKIEFVLNNL